MIIEAAARIIGDGNITILSDSQAAILALHSKIMKFKTVYSCCIYLSEVSEQYDVHMDTGTQCYSGRMNWLVRVQPPNSPTLGNPVRPCRLIVVRDRCPTLHTGRTVRKVWPRLDEGSTRSLLKPHRCSLSVIVGVLTGHYIMRMHAKRIGLAAKMRKRADCPSLVGYMPDTLSKKKKY